MRRHNIHGYIHRMAEVWYPHMDISMDISRDIHARQACMNVFSWPLFWGKLGAKLTSVPLYLLCQKFVNVCQKWQFFASVLFNVRRRCTLFAMAVLLLIMHIVCDGGPTCMWYLRNVVMLIICVVLLATLVGHWTPSTARELGIYG